MGISWEYNGIHIYICIYICIYIYRERVTFNMVNWLIHPKKGGLMKNNDGPVNTGNFGTFLMIANNVITHPKTCYFKQHVF